MNASKNPSENGRPVVSSAGPTSQVLGSPQVSNPLATLLTSENSGSVLNGVSLDGKPWKEVDITWSGEGIASDDFGRGKDRVPKEGEETVGGEKANHAAFWKALLEERFLAQQALSEVGSKGRRASKAISFGNRGEARESVLQRQLSERSKRGPKKVFERASERASEIPSKKALEKGLKRALSGKGKAKLTDEDKKAQMIEKMKRLNQPLDLSDLDIHAAASKSMEQLDSLRDGDALGSKTNKSELDRSSSKGALSDTVHIALSTAVHTEQIEERQEGHQVNALALAPEASQPVTEPLMKDRKETHRQRGALSSGDSSSEDEPILTRKKPGVKKGDQSPLGTDVNTSIADIQTARDTAEEAVVPDPFALVSNSDALVSNPDALVLDPDALISKSDAAVRVSDAPAPDSDDQRTSWAAGGDARSPERPENPNTPERPEEGGRTVTHLAEPEGCVPGDLSRDSGEEGEKIEREEREKIEGEERETIEGVYKEQREENEWGSDIVGSPIENASEAPLLNPGAESEKGEGRGIAVVPLDGDAPRQVEGSRENEGEEGHSNDSGPLSRDAPRQVGGGRETAREDGRSNDSGPLIGDASRQVEVGLERGNEREEERSNEVGLLSRDAAGDREKANGIEGREQGRSDDGGLFSGDSQRQVEGGQERVEERSNGVGLLTGNTPSQVEGGRERENETAEGRSDDVGLLSGNSPSQVEVGAEGETEMHEGGSTAVGIFSGNAPISGVAPPVSEEVQERGRQAGAPAVSQTGALASRMPEAPPKSLTEGAGVVLEGPTGASEGLVGLSEPEGVVSEPEGPSAAAESLAGAGEALVASSENPGAVSEAPGAASKDAIVSGLPKAGEGQILEDGQLSEGESARQGWEKAAEARQNRQLATGGEQLAGGVVDWSMDRVRATLKSLLDHFRAPVRKHYPLLVVS